MAVMAAVMVAAVAMAATAVMAAVMWETSAAAHVNFHRGCGGSVVSGVLSKLMVGQVSGLFRGFQARFTQDFRGFRQDSGVSVPCHEFADSGRIQGPPHPLNPPSGVEVVMVGPDVP